MISYSRPHCSCPWNSSFISRLWRLFKRISLGKIIYSDDDHGKIQMVWYHKTSTNPDPQNMFWFFFTIYVFSLYNLIMVHLFSQFIFTLQLFDFGATLDNILKFEFLGAQQYMNLQILVQNVFKLVKWLRLGSVWKKLG